MNYFTVFCLSLCLLVMGCQTAAFDLPPLHLPAALPALQNLDRNRYVPGDKGDWLYALELTEQLITLAHSELDQATQTLYAITAVTLPINPLTETDSPTQQRAAMVQATAAKTFLTAQLSNAHITDTQHTWSQLLQAEQYFLNAGVIIAELRQKFAREVVLCSENLAYFYDITYRLELLPKIAELEQDWQAATALMSMCRQLMAANPTLLLPRNKD